MSVVRDTVQRLRERERVAVLAHLGPGVDALTRLAATRAEAAVVVKQHGEACRTEDLGVLVRRHRACCRKAVRHDHEGMRSGTVGQEEPRG